MPMRDGGKMNVKDNSLNYWEEFWNKEYERSDIKIDSWLDEFEGIIDKCGVPILDLGSGWGNDAIYLINKGKKVISCDQSINAINNIKKNIPEIYDVKCFNMLDGIPFQDDSFELIIADMCLHYFKERDMFKIIDELKRILVNDGHIIFRVNSINDVNYGAGKGKEIEHHLYETENKLLKRFFDEEDVRFFFKDFAIEYLKEEDMTRYKMDKKIYTVCVKKLILCSR